MEQQSIVSIDTNVLVRFLVEDEGAPSQCEAARELFMRQSVFISESVLLETEWVLRAVYGVVPREIHAAFCKLLRLRQVLVPDKPVLKQVLVHYETGFDFGDALHLVRSEQYEMKTFDSAFVKKARRAGYAASTP